MKLVKVHTQVPISDGTPGGNRAHFTPAQGYEMAYDAGLVTLKKGDWTAIVPMANVAAMEPEGVAPAKKKAATPAVA